MLGAIYGAYVAPTFANASLNAVASTVRDCGGTASEATFAPGDMFVQPLGWAGLSRTGCHRRLRFLRPGRQIQHGHDADPWRERQRAGRGQHRFGFLDAAVSGRSRLVPWTNRATAVTLVLTYDTKPQQETDVKYRTEPVAQLGYQPVPAPDQGRQTPPRSRPAGYYEWQVSSDTGGTSNPSSRTSVSAIGGHIGLTYVPWNLILNFRGMYEYAAEERVQGSSFSINLLKKF